MESRGLLQTLRYTESLGEVNVHNWVMIILALGFLHRQSHT
jgi:hypothetical protein